MATSLKGGGVENCHLLAAVGQLPSKNDILIPKTSLYEGMVVWYRCRTGIELR